MLSVPGEIPPIRYEKEAHRTDVVVVLVEEVLVVGLVTRIPLGLSYDQRERTKTWRFS